MKRLLGSVCLALVFVSSFVTADSRASLRTIERDVDADELTMYTMIHVRELHQELRNTCSSDDISAAEVRADIVLSQLERKYASMNDAEILRHSWDMYERLRKHHVTTADALPENWYCIVKFLMYEIQQYLRDTHLGIFEETNITKDFGGFNVKELHGFATKIRYLDMIINELSPYKDKLGTRLNFEVENKSFVDDLTERQVELLAGAEEIMELNTYKVLYNLKQQGLFTQDDIDELKDKIVFEYVNACGSVNGKYEIRETTTSAGKHVRYATDALRLKVNLCGNFFMIRDLATAYEKIIAHELGHHFFYYHDRLERDEFIDICWEAAKEKNNSCSGRDFVSEYAKTHSNEDYAEHFMYWFLDILPDNQSSVMRKKTKHFEDK